MPNPRLGLDNGHIVYGCECWWGGEEAIRRHLAGKTGAGYSVETGILLAGIWFT